MKPKIVIIGAGMAGITAANKLYTSANFAEMFELSVVEGGTRIGGRINTSEFNGDRIEMGATWIHGIKGSPLHKIAQEIHSLQSEQPWEFMDGCLDEPITVAEGGFELNPFLFEPISDLFKKLMDFAQGKEIEDVASNELFSSMKLAAKSCGPGKNQSLGSFLRQGLEYYRDLMKEKDETKVFDDWTKRAIEDSVFAMHENTQRTYTSASDLQNLDYNAESEYIMFPGEEITIAKGYLSVVESLASVLPAGLVQLDRKVTRIEWQPDGHFPLSTEENGHGNTKPVMLHFADGSTMSADHVIVTVSLGVLKQGIHEDVGLFNPPLPSFKKQAISKLGYGVVNKLFIQLSSNLDGNGHDAIKFPNLQMVFHQPQWKSRHPKVPWWMRRTASIAPIYSKSRVLLSWFAGEEALELESLSDEDILDGVSSTVSTFLSNSKCHMGYNSSQLSCNGNAKSNESPLMFGKILRSRWGNDPLFLGSYSYVAVGSSGDDFDAMAEPLPTTNGSTPSLQILFAGEATHRTHYSTTHGAHFSGLREANRILQHYKKAISFT